MELLTLRNWLWTVLPHLLRMRVVTGTRLSCQVFEGSRLALVIARALGRVTGIRIERMSFRLLDVRDEEGQLVDERVRCFDVTEVQRRLLEQLGIAGDPDAGLRIFVGKAALPSLRRTLLLAQISAWTARRQAASGALLFAARGFWSRPLEEYAARHGVTIVETGGSWEWREPVRRLLGPSGLAWMRALRDRGRAGYAGPPRIERCETPASSAPRIGVSCLGPLNLDRPELYSELFFWQRSGLAGEDVVAFFPATSNPLDEPKCRELRAHGMSGISLRPPVGEVRRGTADGWLTDQLSRYRGLTDYWTTLFERERVKVHVSWYKYDEAQVALAGAMRRAGGVAAIHQRAYEGLPSRGVAIDADVAFRFSRHGARTESESGSRVRYCVTTGYLGDHRVPLLRPQAARVREALLAKGARRVIAFCDENSHDDERWLLGHAVTRANHGFLLEQLLREPWLGLVLKPKAPASLPQRLGQVGELLQRAQATGRCLILGEGESERSYPPAAAALAADVAVHGHLCAATAGMEAALAGVPTLLMDLEGWPVSPLNRLGAGRVVFTDWQDLWNALTEHWGRPGGTPGFGDWSPLLDELDPFRDGRAAERMGMYLQWLLDGFKRGLDRESVMADAAERYCAMWGAGMVTEVGVRGSGFGVRIFD